jgi:hypothetical protein
MTLREVCVVVVMTGQDVRLKGLQIMINIIIVVRVCELNNHSRPSGMNTNHSLCDANHSDAMIAYTSQQEEGKKLHVL